ncbi:hypothetical protein [Terribacillus sp. DMT04]|uniref:hypothetical protein n=1 Tax=Terribacillus sp. DMT04 TaxID=2850441 RepID=UPI001C2BE477|nr:hypothetical protein [Terribacillus sp. DMT04]QXE02760.1 hypothetical protein KS242_06150 [Terribacillus sp. DMT04]
MTDHPGSIRYECLNCKSTRSTIKGKYGEVIVCEVCNGAMVDVFYIHKYKAAAETKPINDLQIKVEVDTAELDAAIEKARKLDELEVSKYIHKYGPNKKEKLLVIELDDIDSIPKIIFKGKQVDGIHELDIAWHSESESNAATGVRYTQSDTDREISVVYGD